ncbi:Os03g0192666 [Oryza sativa Japonica Group]|uniref:Os03g0192666 protein n=1 Tax=Oryza sativa subsp. japonica TaxID=39947 RepID=A0A0P0VU51_ORYSJ|nr:Os03g0192666 [Oryza sativa Japonica Group]
MGMVAAANGKAATARRRRPRESTSRRWGQRQRRSVAAGSRRRQRQPRGRLATVQTTATAASDLDNDGGAPAWVQDARRRALRRRLPNNPATAPSLPPAAA